MCLYSALDFLLAHTLLRLFSLGSGGKDSAESSCPLSEKDQARPHAYCPNHIEMVALDAGMLEEQFYFSVFSICSLKIIDFYASMAQKLEI